MSLEQTLRAGFGAALGVPQDDALRAYVRGSGGVPRGSASLLGWDANSIHTFVFDTTNAAGIRGASAMLREIDTGLRSGERLGLVEGQVLFAGGGSGLAVVAADQVESCKRLLHRLFAEGTGIATCTTAAVELAAGDKGFAERVRAVGRALARDRILTGPDAEPAVPFFAARCEVCGRRAAAARQWRVKEGRDRLECEPCSLRIERGKGLVKSQQESAGFEEIADRNGEGFYAAIYLDGNGIGKTIAGLKSPLAFASFSRAIERIIGESFRETAARYDLLEDTEDRRSKGRYQLPICGGDDVVAILPGEIAVPFTRDLLACLESKGDVDGDLGRKGIILGASAGVAIGHIKFPIRHLLTEAEALLSIAKRRAYDKTPARSALSFAVVTDGSPRSESIEAERWARMESELLLSGRPYTLEELGEFSRRFLTVHRAKGVGRTQLYSLSSHAVRGPRQFRNHVLYQIGRREEWRDLVADLAQAPDKKALLRDPDACTAQFAPTYSGRQVFDIADMIDLLRHWREAEENPTS